MTDSAAGAAGAADAPLTILRIIARLNVGGPARHVLLLNRGLDRRGHDTLLVHGALDRGEAGLAEPADAPRLRIVTIPDLGRRISPLSDLRAFVRLVAIVFRERPDVVHTHTAKAGALGRVAAWLFNATRGRRRRAAVVHTYHGHVFEGYFSPSVNTLIRVTERALASITDRVLTISPRQEQDIVSRFHIASAEQTSVVPLGLDLTSLLALSAETPGYRAQWGWDAGQIVVGSVGRMVPIKDLSTLLRAFGIARQRTPELRLMLAGDGPSRPEIERELVDLGLGPYVKLLGWTDDLPGVYATMDICALSSLNEGTPVAVIEAMAAARAVVATAVGGVPDLVQDGATGLLVPPQSPDVMAGALVRLAADAGERRRLGANGRRHVVERYASARLVDDVEEIYRSTLAIKRSR